MAGGYTVEAVPNCQWLEDVFLDEFIDHAGQQAFRYGARMHKDENDPKHGGSITDNQSWPPEDYNATPYFCFQVYITFDFELSKEKCRTLAGHLINLQDVDAEPLLWEFYIGSRPVLDCIDHSRHEIAHRMILDQDVPRIYPLQHTGYDERKVAFAFIIDNDRGWHISLQGSQFDDLHFPDHTGPLWAHFDPRIPSAVTRIDDTMIHQTDLSTVSSDQLDSEVLRIQGGEAEGDMMLMYELSTLTMEDNRHGRDTLDSSSNVSDASYPVDLGNAAQLIVSKHAGITIANTEDEADMRYAIFTPLSTDLEHIARTFAASVSGLTSKSFRFDLQSATSDADALAACRSTALHSLALTAQPVHQAGATTGSSLSIRRPQARSTYFQDSVTPANLFNIYCIIIDRKDFLGLPAVRFLFGAGWPQDHEENNYMEAASLRSANMQAVVDRMMLEFSSADGDPKADPASGLPHISLFPSHSTCLSHVTKHNFASLPLKNTCFRGTDQQRSIDNRNAVPRWLQSS